MVLRGMGSEADVRSREMGPEQAADNNSNNNNHVHLLGGGVVGEQHQNITNNSQPLSISVRVPSSPSAELLLALSPLEPFM